MKKLFGIFDKRPLIWFHYVLLTGGLFGLHYLGDILFKLDTQAWYYMFIFYFLGLALTDQLIHAVIRVD